MNFPNPIPPTAAAAPGSTSAVPVAAMITEGPDAFEVASRAADAAAGGRVLVLIPLLRPGFTTDAAIAQRMDARLGAAADAVFARVRGIFQRAGAVAEVRIVRHAPGRALAAVKRRAAKAGIAEVFVPGFLVDPDAGDDVASVGTRNPVWSLGGVPHSASPRGQSRLADADGAGFRTPAEPTAVWADSGAARVEERV